MNTKWEKMVARHWYPLPWSGSAHIQKDGLKFGDLYWKVKEYLAVRFGNPHITDFCTTENFIDTNFKTLICEINPSINIALDEIDQIVGSAFEIIPGNNRDDAMQIFEKYKVLDGIMLMSFYFGPMCQDRLKEVIGEDSFNKYQTSFSKPSSPTLWTREHDAITKSKIDIKSLNLDDEAIKSIALNLALEYGFIHSDIRATAWTSEDYLKELTKTVDNSQDSTLEYKTDDVYVNWLMKVVSRVSYAFDEGKCGLIRAIWALRQTIINIGADESKVMKCSEDEFRGWVATGELPDVDLGIREEYHAMYTRGDVYEEVFGMQAVKAILDREGITEFEEIKEEATTLKGQIAFKGKVQGIVRKTYSEKDANALIPGEILVASMTQPELMRGMMNAAAFITDEGGLLCHAAIIARELKKPCIIGTKIATKVLKDGDLVEVDAEKGVVRIIRKQE